jgi:lipoprotein-anchoring transpeptidase ErfK/SrfK
MVKKPAQNLEKAKVAIRKGELPKARQLLRQLTREDPRNYTAWLLLAKVTPSPQAALEYVKRAERLRPESHIVHRVRSSLEQDKIRETKNAGRSAWWPVSIVSGCVLLLMFLVMWLVPTTRWDQVVALKGDDDFNAGATSNFAPTLNTDHQAMAMAVESPLSAPTATISPTVTAKENLVHIEATPGPQIKNEGSIAVVTNNETSEAAFSSLESGSSDTEAMASGQTSVMDDIAVDTNQVAIVDPTGLRPNGVGEDERWIDVELNTQTLVAYEGNTPVFHSLISSGTWEYPTVTGQYRTWMKYESQDMNGYQLGYDYYLTNVPHVMYFYRDFAIHGAYWHNNFGSPMSHGCVNMNTVDAGWLYNWAPLGTLVNIHH